MTYKLKAEIDDMSRNEARALVAAILERFGSSIVDEEMKRWTADKERQDRMKQALKNQVVCSSDQSTNVQRRRGYLW